MSDASNISADNNTIPIDLNTTADVVGDPVPPASAASDQTPVVSGSVTLTAEQFAALLAEASKARAVITTSGPATATVVHLTLEEAPQKGDIVRDPHGRPALVLEVLETERGATIKGADGKPAASTWTQVVCVIGSFTESRTLDAEELREL